MRSQVSIETSILCYTPAQLDSKSPIITSNHANNTISSFRSCPYKLAIASSISQTCQQVDPNAMISAS